MRKFFSVVALIVSLICVMIPKETEVKEKPEGEEVYFQYITLGCYEQDNNILNDKEDIEWIVLYEEDGKALVTSRYALDCLPYNTESENVTWETCTLRQWLNNEFINETFTEEEKTKILTSHVSADDNSTYGTDAGNTTEDKIFLLSISEAEKYFNSNATRACAATVYAEAQGAYNRYNGNCWWWLRSPGDFRNDASVVGNGGGVSYNGFDVDLDSSGVRPAMWITLD